MQNWKSGEQIEKDRERLQCSHCSCRQWDTARANTHSRTHTRLSAQNHRSILTILNPFHSICKSAGRVLAYSRANVSSLGDLSLSLLSLCLCVSAVARQRAASGRESGHSSSEWGCLWMHGLRHELNAAAPLPAPSSLVRSEQPPPPHFSHWLPQLSVICATLEN